MPELLTRYDQISPREWDQLAQSSPYATWFTTREAYLFYASLPREFRPILLAVREQNRLTGLLLGYLTASANPLLRPFTRRAIFPGGALLDPAISPEALTALLRAARQALAPQAIYIEFRNLHDYTPFRDLFRQAGFDYRPHLNIHIDTSDLAAATARFRPNRRRQVRQALAAGATIAPPRSEDDIRAFYKILRHHYTHTIRKPLPSLRFFLTLYRTQAATFLLIFDRPLAQNETPRVEKSVPQESPSTLPKVATSPDLIGGIVCPILPGRALYEWYICSLDRLYPHLHPSVLATYAALRYAADHRLPRFDMMGAGTPDVPYGVRDFKLRFGGTVVEHGRFLHLASPRLYRLATRALSLLHRP